MKIIKMSVNLSTDAVATLKKLAVRRRATMTAVLHQAVGTEKFIDAVNKAGGKILIEDKRGRIRQLVFR